MKKRPQNKGRISWKELWNMYQNSQAKLRNMSLRMKKIRNEIDYMLDHPYSAGTGTNQKKR